MPQDATDLAERLRVVGPVTEAQGARHEVEALVGEGQCFGAPTGEVELGSGLAGGAQHPGRPV